MEKRESKVKDLEEKLRRGELTPKEAKKIMHARGLGEQESWKWQVSGYTIWAAYFILWLFPAAARQDKTELPAIHFPTIVIYISAVLLATAIVLAVWMVRSHRKWGGLREAGETVIFYKKGPYRIMRHPGVFCLTTWLVLLPVILSVCVRFTLLSVAAIVIMVTFNWYIIYVEEKINTEKWGDQYQQYMKEVPRFNFILGVWRLRKTVWG